MNLTFLGGLVQLLGAIYYVLAAVVIAVALVKPKTRQAKAIATSIAIVVFGFFPVKGWLEKRAHDAYAKEAWAYFRKMCEEKSGEKIYKQYSGVKSVVVLKPLPPATEKDLYDQYWYGDPYSNATPWEKRGESVAKRLVGSSRLLDGKLQRGLEYVEIKSSASEPNGYIKISRPKTDGMPSLVERAGSSESKFGILWEDISTIEDRKHWVAASRLRIIEKETGQVIAERTGFLIEGGFGSGAGQRRPWLAARGPDATCPKIHGDYADQQFVARVFARDQEM